MTHMQAHTKQVQSAYALIIGVGKASNKLAWSLPVTVKDAQAVAKVLQNPDICAYQPENVRLLHDQFATGDQIYSDLHWLAKSTEHNPNSTAIVYFSGHGWRSEDDSYALIPSDVNPKKFKDSIIAGERFTDAIAQIVARRLLVILDCCHAGGIQAKGRELALQKGYFQSPLPDNYIKKIVSLQQGEGRSVICSSRSDQLSYYFPDGTMSIFTYHLLEAFAGIACKPGEAVVRETHIFQHVSKMVPQTSLAVAKQEQTPWRRMEGEDIPIAMVNQSQSVYNHLPTLFPSNEISKKRFDQRTVMKLLEMLSDLQINKFANLYYPEVYNNYAGEMQVGRKRLMLLEHCQRSDTLETLLDNLEQDAPDQFRLFATQLRQ